ncbi:MAG: class I SAM-dependent methyltransferase [Terracidiphilus sp.]
MLGIPVRYFLKHPAIAFAEFTANPIEVWTTVQDTFVARRESRRPQCPYEPDSRWEQRLHEYLGLHTPCSAAAEFSDLWPAVIKEIEAKGIQAGPESFQCWNDGDAGLVRAIWCLVRHLKPKKIVETGVAHGVTSRFILEALERNGDGHLWSIDLPPMERDWREQVAVAVGDRYADRWSYIRGSSRRRLPELLTLIGQVDLFIHDSLHSERNVRFELDRAWPVLGQSGAVVVDDIDANWGFQSFNRSFSGHPTMICEAEPIRPDRRRFNQKGLFGIILRQSTQPTEE